MGPSRSRTRSLTPRRTMSRSRTPRSDNGYRDERRPDSRSRSRSRGRDRTLTPETVDVSSSTKIVVEKLTKNVNEDHLREIFSHYGKIEGIEVPMHRFYNFNRGNAFIIYTSVADAETAVANMHEAQLDGAILTVSIVLPSRKFRTNPPPAALPRPKETFAVREPLPPPREAPPPRERYADYGYDRFRSPPPRRRSPPRYGGRDTRGPPPRERERNYGYGRPRSYTPSRSRSSTRSPSYDYRRASPPRRTGARSRSRSPRRDMRPRSRSPSYSRSRTRTSLSRTPPPRRDDYRSRAGPNGRDTGRRRSPSYSSYSRSRSRSRSFSRDRGGYERDRR